MDNKNDISTKKNLYNWGFVILLIFMLGSVMILSLDHGYNGFTEHFFQKNFLIENFNRLLMKIGNRVFPQVLIGKDGWMEFTGGGNLDDFQNAVPFTQADLELLGNNLLACQRYAEEQGFTLLVVIAPNKASIYPDKLPDQIQPSPKSKMDQLNEYLEHQNISGVLGLRPVLREARQHQPLYYKTDTHWNGYGAYTAYTEILEVLGKNYPELKAYPLDFFRIKEKLSGTRDIARMIQANFIFEPLISAQRQAKFVKQMEIQDPSGFHQISWIPDSNLPILLMYHDSFGYLHLNDYLKVNFGKANFISLASVKYLNQGTIEQTTPDIIILEIVERNLISLQLYLSALCTEYQ